ncbi:hypothetical protein EEZ25_27075 [Micromonospora aurantiaca]|uniref:hypothetical protein n=1 Tax=Micromonospora aurantiaca (nom. illeg.) TaxID=47850 RepID=UPI000F3F940F|nr:hypothetical protein [Micromonospora aurantiaca]RNH98229.1 hypothetical protein EEZ25_27075 [Micromonospora aurantiaca]
MDDTGRLQLARQLLRERTEDYRPARRLFVLLFGQRVSHLAVLARTAMMADDGRVSLALSDIPIRLREPLAGLALEVATPPPAALRVPSSQGNRPLSPERLRERLAALGLSGVLLALNGAVGALAGQLGLSLSAATAWSEAVGAARGDYTALRSGRLSPRHIPAASWVRQGSPIPSVVDQGCIRYLATGLPSNGRRRGLHIAPRSRS